MTLRISTMCAALAMAVMAYPAAAQGTKTITESRTVASGRIVVVGNYGSTDTACNTRGIPEVTVKQPPSHGTLTITQEKVKMRRSLLGTVDCSGHEVDGTRATFSPVTGYLGPDRTVLQVKFPAGVIEYTYDITVTPAR